MKKLSKLKLMSALDIKLLDREEQKEVMGGYTESYCCYWKSNSGDSRCTKSVAEAAHMGTYHWECNTLNSKKYCNC